MITMTEAAGAAAAVDLAALRGDLDAIRLPAADLPGWESLCAREYAVAVRALAQRVEAARAALEHAAHQL